MAEKRDRAFDIVVLGASGVTGKYVLEELAKCSDNIKWCAAGRSRERVKAALEEAGELTGKDLQNIEILEVNVDDKESLNVMCKSTKLVVNCVGPYRFYGEQVVAECVNCGTHHLDVSGEPQFLETMQLKYFEEAKAKKTFIIGSCGFDSIPCDLGVEYVKDKFDGDVCFVETYLKLNGQSSTSNFATWQSAVHGFAHYNELKPLKTELTRKLFPKEVPKISYMIPKRPVLFYNNDLKTWCLQFPGSDRSVIRRTQMYNYQFRNHRPVQIQTYFCLSSLISALAVILMAIMFHILVRFRFGRHLLEKYPEVFSFGVFSRKPPLRSKAFDGSYSFTFNAVGWPKSLLEPTDQHTNKPCKLLTATVTGQDAGYVSTAVCLVISALVVLQETEKLPDVGGVYSPGAAFRDTSLIERLQACGVAFKIEK